MSDKYLYLFQYDYSDYATEFLLLTEKEYCDLQSILYAAIGDCFVIEKITSTSPGIENKKLYYFQSDLASENDSCFLFLTEEEKDFFLWFFENTSNPGDRYEINEQDDINIKEFNQKIFEKT